MHIPASSRKPQDGIPTSSMADIAFLLLIFFLVTTVFPKDEGLSVVLPRSDEVVDIAPGNILQLVVLESGLVEVRRGAESRGETVPVSRLAAVWKAAFASNERLVALVRTHPNAPYRSMIDVLDGLAEARAPRISLQVLEER